MSGRMTRYSAQTYFPIPVCKPSCLRHYCSGAIRSRQPVRRRHSQCGIKSPYDAFLSLAGQLAIASLCVMACDKESHESSASSLCRWPPPSPCGQPQDLCDGFVPMHLQSPLLRHCCAPRPSEAHPIYNSQPYCSPYLIFLASIPLPAVLLHTALLGCCQGRWCIVTPSCSARASAC